MIKKVLFVLITVCLIFTQLDAAPQYKFFGDIRFRPEYLHNTDYASASSSYVRNRIRFGAQAEVNDFTTALIRMDFGDAGNRYWGDNLKNGISTANWRFRLSQGYIFFDKPNSKPFQFTLGRQSLKLGDAIIFDDDSDGIDGINAAYLFKKSSIHAIWFKLYEGTLGTSADDDIDWYGAYAELNDIIPAVSFQPYFLVNTYNVNSTADTTNGGDVLYYAGLRITGTVDKFEYKAEYVKQFGDYGNVNNTIDKDAEAVVAGLFYKFPFCKAGIEYFFG